MMNLSNAISLIPDSKRKLSRADISRNSLCLILLFVSSLTLAASQLVAADKDNDADGTATTIVSADGWPLKMTYYKSTEGRESAVVILLHGKGESRLAWTNPKDGFAKTLHSQGFAVVALDLRKHGQSKPGETEEEPTKKDSKDKSVKKSGSSELKPVDYQAMVIDLAAVKRFIFDEHQKEHLNMRKTAIVAPGMSAALAVIFTAEDWAKKPYSDASTLEASTPRGQDIQSLVFLSPETTVPGLQAHVAAPLLKQLPIASLVWVAKDDAQDKEQAKKLFQQVGGDPAKTQPKKGETKKPDKKDKDKSAEKDKLKVERLEYFELPGKLRGTDLLGKKLGVEEITTKFLKAHLKELKGPTYDWRDRKSKLAD